tara:strand:+ start:3619 stop:3924 length:306 start_codon:yes stop_codon:yes gene_type:complete
MSTDKDENQLLHELMIENQRLLAENNKILRQIKKATIWSFWIRFAWFLILIGAPFVLYYFVVEPYFDALGSSFETFTAGLQEVPGWKQFYGAVSGNTEGGE